MNAFEQDQLRARTDALQGQVDTLLATYERQLRDIDGARAGLATATAQGWSDDNLVRVTVNAAGVPIEVWIDPSATKRAVPEKLGTSFLQAAQSAARAAKAEIDAALAPVTAAAAEFAPPEDVFSGLPFIGRPIGDILPEPPVRGEEPPGAEPPAADDEDEDGPHWKGLGASNNGW